MLISNHWCAYAVLSETKYKNFNYAWFGLKLVLIDPNIELDIP